MFHDVFVHLKRKCMEQLNCFWGVHNVGIIPRQWFPGCKWWWRGTRSPRWACRCSWRRSEQGSLANQCMPWGKKNVHVRVPIVPFSISLQASQKVHYFAMLRQQSWFSKIVTHNEYEFPNLSNFTNLNRPVNAERQSREDDQEPGDPRERPMALVKHVGDTVHGAVLQFNMGRWNCPKNSLRSQQ